MPEEPAPEEPEPEEPLPEEPAPQKPPPEEPPFEPADPFPSPPEPGASADGRLELDEERSELSGTPIAYADGAYRAQYVLRLRAEDGAATLLVGARVEWEVSGSGNDLIYADAALRGTTGEARAELTSTVPETKTVTAIVTRGTTDRWVFSQSVEFRPPIPAIDSVSPTFGPLTGGNTVTIRGTSLASSTTPTTVSFGATPAQVLSANADEVSVVAPPATSFGVVDVHVTVGGVTGRAPAAYEYRLVSSDTCTFLPDTDRLLALADVDGDRRTDFLVTGRQHLSFDGRRKTTTRLALGVVRNAGEGDRILPIKWSYLFSSGAQATSLVVDDFDLDGRPDAAVGIAGLKVTEPLLLLRGAGDGSFDLPEAYVAGGGVEEHLADMATGSLDRGLGTPDLVVATRAGVDVFLMQVKGQPPIRASYGAGATLAVELADVTGDRVLDIISLGADATLRVLTGNGDGTFTTGSSAPAGWSPRGLAVGDLDGDGRPDAVVASRPDGQLHYTGYLRVFRGDGAGGFASVPFELAVPDLGDAVAIGQLTADGAPDLTVYGGDSTSPDLRLVPGNGDGTLGTPVTIAPTQSQGAVLARDVTGDGRADVVAKHDGGLCVHEPDLP